jgi:hypothetical protein
MPLATRGGNKRTVSVREVVNGVMYVLGTAGSGQTRSDGVKRASCAKRG